MALQTHNTRMHIIFGIFMIDMFYVYTLASSILWNV